MKRAIALLFAGTTGVSSGFLQVASPCPSRRITTSEFRVARAETRTTGLTNFDDDNNESFGKLCELLCPEQSDKIQLDESSDGLRGVYTTSKMASGDVILSVPLEYCLRDDETPSWMGDKEAVDEEGVSMDNNGYSASGWAKRLASSLIELQLEAVEAMADASGELWLSLLPEAGHLRATLPIHWSEDVLASAHCSALELAVDSAYFARAETTAGLLLSLEQRSPAAEYLRLDNLRLMTENALDIVQTRTCRVETADGSPLRLLAPLFDMLNHRNRPNAAFALEHVQSYDGETYQALMVRATEEIAANTEVFVSYGASTKPSWRCLASYGFVPTYDPAQNDNNDEQDHDSDELLHSAEVFLEGMRYEVGPGSVSQELVDAMQDCIDPTLPKPASLTSQVALRLAQRISEAAFQMLLDDSGTGSLDEMPSVEDDSDNDDQEDDSSLGTWSLAHVISARQAAALRWNQHRILMSCSLGLRDWAAGQSGGLSM